MGSNTKVRVLITGGPTRTYLDHVRFISNLSSGDLAYELARTFKRSSMEVCLIVGPSANQYEKLGVRYLARVETTEQMHAQVLKACKKFKPHFAIFAAAVLDFRPSVFFKGKVSSGKSNWQIQLTPTPKIIDDVATKFPDILRIGFKLESGRMNASTMRKMGKEILQKKQLAALSLNFLQDVRGTSHVAHLFFPGGKYLKANSKKQIALYLRDYVRSLE
ncbi:MAG: hypothetical protein HY537_03320 [Deltaproteobacteria bacterium]|nr:hypothetical protein [Deltaproteobacteria bacterium]